MKRTTATAALAVLIGLTTACDLTDPFEYDSVEDQLPIKGRVLNVFDASLGEKEVSVSDFKGRLVIVDFWAGYCGPCLGMMPTVHKYAAAHQKEVVVIAYNVGVVGADQSGPANVARTYRQFALGDPLAKTDTTTNTLVLAGDAETKAAWGIAGIPAFLFFDTEGKEIKLRADQPGRKTGEITDGRLSRYMAPDEFNAIVDGILKENTPRR